MEKRNVNTNLVAALLIVVAVLGYGLIGKAGNLDPNDPPAPTMKTLQEIYDAVQATQNAVVDEGSGVSQREGYVKYAYLTDHTPITMFTVPEGKKAVLLKLFVNVTAYNWNLTVNDNIFIHGSIFINQEGTSRNMMMWDFPDRCVVFDAGDVVKVVNNYVPGDYWATLIGYYYDVP